MTGNAFTDRRQFGRRTTNMQAWIETPGRPRVACIVLDLSEAGAKLQLLDDSLLPQSFNLVLPTLEKSVRAHVRHVGVRTMGIEFNELIGVPKPKVSM